MLRFVQPKSLNQPATFTRHCCMPHRLRLSRVPSRGMLRRTGPPAQRPRPLPPARRDASKRAATGLLFSPHESTHLLPAHLYRRPPASYCCHCSAGMLAQHFWGTVCSPIIRSESARCHFAEWLQRIISGLCVFRADLARK